MTAGAASKNVKGFFALLAPAPRAQQRLTARGTQLDGGAQELSSGGAGEEKGV